MFHSHLSRLRARRGVIGLACAVAVAFAAQSGEEGLSAYRELEPVDVKVETTPRGERFIDISVLTYNVKGLPWPLRLDLAEADAGTAMAVIGHHLGRLRADGQAPNIVLVQEGFPDETALIGLNGGYRYAVAGPREEAARTAATADDEALAADADWSRAETQGPLLNSGLYAFSDFPMTVEESRAFGRHACAGYDCLAAKGVLAVAVHIPGVPVPVNTMTLHMNAGARTAGVTEERAAAAHRLQMARFAEVLEQLDSSYPLIVGGDFNVKQDPYRQRFADERLGGAGLAAVHVRCREPSSFCRAGYPARWGAHWLEPRDVQGFRDGDVVRVTPLSSEPMFAGPLTGGKMSDHIGYLVHYRLSWTPHPVQVALGN